VSSAVKFVFFFVALIGLMTFGFSKLFEADTSGVSRTDTGELRYFGTIDQERVEKAIAHYQPGDRLVIRSTGGDLHAGMMFGDFIHQQQMSVEVVDFCISSCANYIFLAGATKILNSNALVVFHGGPKQANFRSLMQQAYAQDAAPGTVFGREGYEAIISRNEARRAVTNARSGRNSPCAQDEILNFNGQCEAFGPEQRLQYIIYLEEELYSRFNPQMDKNIPYYGQLGEYETTYLAYRYFGFYYDVETLAKLNVRNVVVKGGEWRPQTNPLFRQVYEVSL
jgi:hypothetical protein